MNFQQCKAMARVLRKAHEDGEAGARSHVAWDLKNPASLGAYFVQSSVCKALADAYDAAAEHAGGDVPDMGRD